MMEYMFLLVIVFFVLIMDLFGNILLFILVMWDVLCEWCVKLILCEVGIVFVILLFFMVVGDCFLWMMSFIDLLLWFGGGIVLFLIVLWMIFLYLDGVFGSDLCVGGELFIVLFVILVLVGLFVFVMVMLLML